MRAELIPENKVLIITLTNRDEELIVERSGATLNMAFETSPASILVLARESADTKARIEQAISVVTCSESIRSAYHHGVFIITKEAWRTLGTFRPDVDAELAFVEIFEANRRGRACDQSIQGSLRELRAYVELQVSSELLPSRDSLKLVSEIARSEADHMRGGENERKKTQEYP